MFAFCSHALLTHYQYMNQAEQQHPYYKQLFEMRGRILSTSDNFILEESYFNLALKDALSFNESPSFFVQEWCEAMRSFFSGLGKGQKFCDFAGNPLQVIDGQGEYHDTPVMGALSLFVGFVFAGILSLRA
jgi:hypothetical protein